MLAALAACLLTGAVALAGEDQAPAGTPPRPNIVLIQTDDQTLNSIDHLVRLYPGGPKVTSMPYTRRLIMRTGVAFTRYYASYPLCCPSRASLLTGRYAHNHKVRGNNPPGGGWPPFDRHHNLAVWLQRAGYRTVHIGKIMNFYGEPPHADPQEVPPGWSEWQTLVGEEETRLYYGYELNEGGSVTGPWGHPGDPATRTYVVKDPPECPDAPPPGLGCNYLTDALTQRAVDAIYRAPPQTPFFLQLDYTAPHGDSRAPIGPEPAPRHYDSFAEAPLPRPPSFNEGNLADKPQFIRDAPLLSPAEIRQTRREFQKVHESLRGVDEGVARVIQALNLSGRMENTYVLYTSDNGFFQGEHRLHRAKFLAYEPATLLPLYIRGPGIPRNKRSGELTANVDITPTILQLAGARADAPLDGRSSLRFALDPKLRSQRALLYESFVEVTDVEPSSSDASASAAAPPKDYVGIRLGDHKYIEWPTGEKELYDLAKDPHELNSRHLSPRYGAIRNFLARKLASLINCHAAMCKREIREPLPEPGRF